MCWTCHFMPSANCLIYHSHTGVWGFGHVKQMTEDPSVPTFPPPILPAFLSLKTDLPVLFKISIWHHPDAAFKSYHITSMQKATTECFSQELTCLAMLRGTKLAFVGQCGFITPCWVHSFFFYGGQCINQMEVRRGDLFYPTQHISFVITLSFHCRLPGTKLCHWWDFVLFLQLSAPGEWQTTAGSRCYCFSHTDFALMCQIKHMFFL